MKLTEDDIEDGYDADQYYIEITKIFDSEKERDDFKKQILDDHEKARILDRLEIEPADLPTYVDECKKLRELIEKEIEKYKPYSEPFHNQSLDKILFQRYTKLLEKSKI